MRALTAVCLLIAAQGVVGLVQYHSALPAEWVWVHASLPAVLWSTLVWAWMAAGSPAPAVAGERARARPTAAA
jgi:heme A synthase